jgi:hypothetical protein
LSATLGARRVLTAAVSCSNEFRHGKHAKVYAAWLGITAIGAVGYLLVRRGYRLGGLCAIAVYAALGFDGLAHYRLAPLSDHTAAMNLTIWLEVATAALLLIAAAGLAAKQVWSRGP